MKLAELGRFALICAAALFAYGFVQAAKDGEARRTCSALCRLKPHYAAATRRAPDFELPNLEGKMVRLSSYRGKVVILNFWSKTCGPCLEEMPSLAALGHALKNRKDIVLLTVTTDESAEDAKNTIQSVIGEAAPFEVLVDPDAKVVADRFGTKLYPETWYIDTEGVIRARIDGARDYSDKQPLNFAESLLAPWTCPATFSHGEPEGSAQAICEG